MELLLACAACWPAVERRVFSDLFAENLAYAAAPFAVVFVLLAVARRLA